LWSQGEREVGSYRKYVCESVVTECWGGCGSGIFQGTFQELPETGRIVKYSYIVGKADKWNWTWNTQNKNHIFRITEMSLN